MATHRSRSVEDLPPSQRVAGIYGNPYGTDDWKTASKRRVTLLPPDFRCAPQLLQKDSHLYKGVAKAPGGMYNYDNMAELEEEPLIREHEDDDRDRPDHRRKTHFELQAASAIIDVDSAYCPGGQARTKAEAMNRHSVRSRVGRRAYAECAGHPMFATNWDSSLTRKHDLAISLPPGVAEKIQQKAWKQVERSLRGTKTGFMVQPEIVPGCTNSSLNMSNVDSSLLSKFGSTYSLPHQKQEKRRSRRPKENRFPPV